MTENKEEILFSGTGLTENKEEISGTGSSAFRKPERRATWVVVIEEAFKKLTSTEEGKHLYGDPQKGASIEQAWRTRGLFGKLPVCLLATGKLAQPVGEIRVDEIRRAKKLNEMDPQQLVSTLADIFRLSDNTAAQVFYYDSKKRIGHSIALLKYDANTSRFTYHDSVPGDSLLCKENNLAGIDAQPEGYNDWSITVAELEKVIIAAFVNQEDFLKLTRK